jgi:hypothetical protein
MKERVHARAVMRVGVAAVVTGVAVFDFFPRPENMSTVASRSVDQWLAKQPGNFAFMEYPIPQHGYGGPAIYSRRLTGKRIIMGSSQNPPNFVYWSDLSAFPSPSTLDLLYRWGAKYVLVDENLYRPGSSFWNVYQTWDTLESSIKESPRLKEVAVLDGVHVYQLGSGSHDNDSELLTNGSFEDGRGSFLPGWKMIGRPTIDRTGKHSWGGRAACAVTAKDFLISAPVPVEAGQCYRLGIRQMTDSTNVEQLRMQLTWKNKDNDDLHVPSGLVGEARPRRQWHQSTMIVRAPAESKYAVMQAGAAGGEIWVDDCSLKKVPTDCEPVLFVTPNPVSVPAGQLGRAAISWNTCCSSEGRVTLKSNNNAEEVFGEGQSGVEFFDRIKPGMHYEFRLYSEQQPTPVQTASLSATERTATIAANPNPVPAGSGLGRTKISWATLAGGDAEVSVSRDGGPEQLFARGPTGSIEVNWIVAGSSYEFRLYSRDTPRRVLAKTVVKQ